MSMHGRSVIAHIDAVRRVQIDKSTRQAGRAIRQAGAARTPAQRRRAQKSFEHALKLHNSVA